MSAHGVERHRTGCRKQLCCLPGARGRLVAVVRHVVGALEQGWRIHKEWLRLPFQRCAVLLLRILWIEFR